MPVKNTIPFTVDGVLDYITQNRGTRYQCSQLARVFKVTAAEMREVVKALAASGLVHSAAPGRYRFYFLPTFDEIALAARAQRAVSRPKTLVVSQAMLDVMARCAEARAIPSKF